MRKLGLMLSASFIIAALTFSSCSKEGPQGPQGEQGQQGPQGPKGDVGATNVIYSAWLDVTYTSNGVATITAPKLTKDILNSGMVKVYVNLDTSDDPFIVAVPCTIPISLLKETPAEADPDAYIDMYLETGKISLVSNYDLSSAGGAFQVRYVLIPGSTNARKMSPDVDWNDYKSVQKYLNLKD